MASTLKQTDAVPLAPARILLTGVSSGASFTTWARRLVSFSLFFILALVLVVTSPITVPLALLLDAVRRKRLATLRALGFFGLYLGCETLGLVAAGWLWLCHLRSSRERFVARNLELQRWWTGTLQRGAFRIFSLRTAVTGAEHAAGGPLIALFRHCSVADTLLPMTLIGIPHRIALRWVLKAELLWDPCLDVVGGRLRNCFVSRMPETRDRDVEAVGQLMDGLGPDDGVVIYPEGTRFSAAKRQRALDRLAQSGDAAALAEAQALEHVLVPRLGGVMALLENNRARADVVFCAHTGLEGIATFADLWNGRVIGNTVHVALWRVPFAAIPEGQKARIEWILREWAEVNAFVAKHAR